jgi:phosphoglycerate dehydrogenase-like enzyme
MRPTNGVVTAAGNENLIKKPHLPRSVILTKTTVYGEMMTEYVFAYILYFNRNLSKHLEDQRNRIWDRKKPGRLSGKVIGILGLGLIGPSCTSPNHRRRIVSKET